MGKAKLWNTPKANFRASWKKATAILLRETYVQDKTKLKTLDNDLDACTKCAVYGIATFAQTLAKWLPFLAGEENDAINRTAVKIKDIAVVNVYKSDKTGLHENSIPCFDALVANTGNFDLHVVVIKWGYSSANNNKEA